MIGAGGAFSRLAPLFEGHRTLRAVIDAVLEGCVGRAVPDRDSSPHSARLDVGCYAIFGGAATAPAARSLATDVRAPVELVPPDDQSWRDLLVAVHGNRLSDRPMRTFAAHALDRERLRRQAAAIPAGFVLRSLDAALGSRLDANLVPHGLQTYGSPARLIEHGCGFGVVHDGALVCAATSYARSAKRVEIAIATHPEFRGRGLARGAAAALIGYCLDHRLVPDWSASNPVSKHLALSLGYRPATLCDIFYLE